MVERDSSFRDFPVRVRGHRHALHRPGDAVTRRRAGEARTRGKLDAPQGRFALRPGLPSSGGMPLVDALALVEVDWARQVAAGTISDAVIDPYTRDARSMVRYVAKRFGVVNVAEVTVNHLIEWRNAPKASGDPVSDNTRRRRLSAAKAFFKTCTCLGIYDLNPAESIPDVQRYDRYVCRLTDAQMEQLCRCAPFTLGETKTPAALALVKIGAGTRETAYVRVCDIDFANDRVWVHDGGERFAPRWLPIDDDWARDALKARVKALADKYPDPVEFAAATVAYERGRKRAADTGLNRQSAVSRTLSALMTKARVHRPGVNRVESIREWVAYRVFTDTGSVEAVAARLGMASLDAAAHIVGYDWVAKHRIDAALPTEPGATP